LLQDLELRLEKSRETDDEPANCHASNNNNNLQTNQEAASAHVTVEKDQEKEDTKMEETHGVLESRGVKEQCEQGATLDHVGKLKLVATKLADSNKLYMTKVTDLEKVCQEKDQIIKRREAEISRIDGALNEDINIMLLAKFAVEQWTSRNKVQSQEKIVMT